MRTVRVEYIVALTGEDGKTELVNKEGSVAKNKIVRYATGFRVGPS